MNLRVRASQRVSAVRQLSVILPSTAVGVGLAIGVFAVTGNLGVGIAALFVLGVGGLVASGFAAPRVDHRLDGRGEPIRVTAESIWLPAPDPVEIPRQGLKARAGWFHRRHYTNGLGAGRGLFVYLEWPGGQVLLEATDGIGEAAKLGVKRYTAPPGETRHLWVWSDELSALIPELDATR